MPSVLQVYTIGVSETSAEDIYNLHEDSDTIEGAAEPSALDTCESKARGRVSSYAQISAVEEFESSFYQVQGHASISSTEVYYDPDTVIGVAEISSIWGDTYIKGMINGESAVSSSGLDLSIGLVTQSNGASKVSARVSYQWADVSTVEAYSQIIDYLYDREVAAFVDSETVFGIVPTDFADYFENGRFTLSSSILSYSSLPGTIGATGPTSSVENMYLRMDTPDSNTVSGEAIVRGFIDEYGDVTGIAQLLSDVPDALGQITSSGHDEDGLSIGVAEAYATSSVARLSADSDGSSLVTEGLYQLITNAAETVYDTNPLGSENKAPDIAFRYTVSAIEEYTYVPALAGYANGESMLPGPTGPTGPVLTVAPTLLYYAPAALVGSSGGSSSVAGNVTVPKSYYDNTVPTAPKEGKYDTGEYA
jgi:hypothetical protein